MIKLINEAKEPKYWNSRFAANVVNAYDSGELTLRNIDEWETNYNDGVKPQPSLGTKEILNYYISTGKDPREDESNNLSDFRGNSRAGNATRVRIKATGRTGWVESVVDDKFSKGIRVIYDDEPGMYPDFFTVDEVEILESGKKPKTESFDDFERYTYMKSKEVYDSDGGRTEYTMYYDEVEDRYVFVFGDSDLYDPNDGYEEFDWECDTEKEADEWFNNYEGFDDLDESICKESIYTDNGFSSRKDYLNSLAADFGIDVNTVYDLASVLGPEEDFDALVTELEDMTDDLEETEDFNPIKHYLDNYAYVVCSTDNTYENFDFIFPYDTYEFAGKELARDLIEYKTETCIFDTRNKTKTDYSPDKLDISKLKEGGRHGWVEDDVDYIDPEIVGKDTAIENIRNILDMCKVKTEKY